MEDAELSGRTPEADGVVEAAGLEAVEKVGLAAPEAPGGRKIGSDVGLYDGNMSVTVVGENAVDGAGPSADISGGESVDAVLGVKA